jgi:hypothetical protein
VPSPRLAVFNPRGLPLHAERGGATIGASHLHRDFNARPQPISHRHHTLDADAAKVGVTNAREVAGVDAGPLLRLTAVPQPDTCGQIKSRLIPRANWRPPHTLVPVVACNSAQTSMLATLEVGSLTVEAPLATSAI